MNRAWRQAGACAALYPPAFRRQIRPDERIAMPALMSVEEARATMLRAAPAPAGEAVALNAAAGRTLFAPVTATRDQPPFRASAMDGWAVRRADIAETPARLAIAGQSAAGARYAGVLGAGEAVRIFTGAPVPDGADWVVIQENARRDGDVVEVLSAGPGAHIRPHGGDFRAGAPLLPAGSLLDAPALGLAAAAGAAELTCARRPRIAILATGPELAAPGAPPGPDQIFESVSPALAALVEAWGGRASRLAPTGDDREAIAAAARARLDETDIFLVVGGASVGDFDLARPAFVSLGADLRVQGVAVRPGKPTWFGVLENGALVLGLPGNPASAQVCARLFLKPLIEAWLGLPQPGGFDLVLARVGAALPANGDREHWMRARVSVDRAGRLVATAFADQDSSLQTVLAGANALLMRPIGAPPAPPGDAVRVLLLAPPAGLRA
jgi:molybdopterin molybdotransferase